MSTITLLIFCSVGALVGLVLGIFMRISYINQIDNDIAVAKKQVEDAPVVIECKLGQEMTLDQMDLNVVTPKMVQIMRHFNVGRADWPCSKKYAEEIYKWYNPNSEYTKLVIVGYLRGGRVQIAWTWKKNIKSFILSRDAISGYEEAIKAACGDDQIFNFQRRRGGRQCLSQHTR